MFGEDRVPADGVFETPDGAASFIVDGVGGTGVVQFGFEFVGGDFLGEADFGDAADLLDDVGGDFVPQDEIAFVLEGTDLFFGEGESE